MAALSDGLHDLYSSIVLPASTNEWLDIETGVLYTLTPEQMHWSKPLGKEFCIVDIDTRIHNQDGQILNDTFSWAKADALSAGMLNHFVYASIHNYSYHILHTHPWPNGDRDNVWTKIPQLKHLLEQDHCRFVISLDSDALFQHLELPLEWLLNKWNFTPETSLLMPNDTAFYVNSKGRITGTVGQMHDTHGVLSINAGVVIAQDLPRTHDILDAWIACPDDEERFPGCSKFRHGWPAEQGAFANYVRYAYNETNDLVTVPCGDANGFPTQGMDCRGTFIRHFTTRKDLTKDGVAQIVMNSLSSLFNVHRNSASNERSKNEAP